MTAHVYCLRSRLKSSEIATIKTYTRKLAIALKVIGLMNVQYAIKDGRVYVLEVNPRASERCRMSAKPLAFRFPKLRLD